MGGFRRGSQGWPDAAPPRPGAAQRWAPPTGDDGSSRTGSVNLTTGAGSPGDRGELAPQLLCEATFLKPEPCTVHIGVALVAQLNSPFSGGSTEQVNDSRSNWDFVADCRPSGGSTYAAQARLIFVFGAGQAKRTVMCDLRPGSYQLPPCNQVSVYVQAMDVSPV